MSKRQDLGVEYLHSEYNCCRSTMLPFIDVIDADEDTLKKLAGPFGAGIGRMRSTCGVVTGMAMTIGLIFGTTDTSDAEAKDRQYEIVQDIANKFKEKHKYIICRDLLGLTDETINTPSNELPQYKSGRVCDDYVRDMIGLIEEKLVELGVEKKEDQK